VNWQPMHWIFLALSGAVTIIGLRKHPERFDPGSPAHLIARWGKGTCLVAGIGGILALVRLALLGP
jgi:hypothetical protein